MEDGEDWLMRPVLEGMCTYESVVNPGLDLSDFARMNDALNIRDENSRRIERYLKSRR